MSRSSLQHVRLREDLRQPPGNLAQLDASAAAGRILRHGQTQSTGVAPRGAVPEHVRADPHPEPLDRFGRLLGPRPSRAQQIAGHASPKTTKLYDRTADTVTVDEIFRDQMATAAAIDRLVHHAVVIEFDVPSYRTDRIVFPFPARSAHDRSGRRVRSF